MLVLLYILWSIAMLAPKILGAIALSVARGIQVQIIH